MKKILTLLLAIFMLLPMIVSCSGDGGEVDQSESDTLTVDTNDDIGEYDFGGEEFTILAREETMYEFEPDEAKSGDAIAEAVYKRNIELEQRFNTKLKFIKKPGSWGHRTEFLTAIRSEYMGGGAESIDLVAGHSALLGYTIAEGIPTDMSKLPEMDFNKSYWSQNIYNDININGKVYMMIGDIGMTLYENMQVMYLNTTLYEENFHEDGGVEGLYQMVDDGTWTYTKLFEIATKYGNGVEDGTYGFVTNAHSWRASFYAQESNVYLKDNDGYYYVPAQMPEKLSNVIDQMVNEFKKPNIHFELGNWTSEPETLNPWFISGNVLFYSQILGESKNLAQNMDKPYTILPLPKYDEYQEQYRTICMDDLTAVMVLTCSDNKTMSGVLTQAMCMLSEKYVTPAVYERSLKTRFQFDEHSQRMIELTRKGLAFTAAESFLGEGSFRIDTFHIAVLHGLTTAPSDYAGSSSSAQKALDKFYAKVEMADMQ